MWSTPESAGALRSRDLATILRLYRRLNHLNQEQLAALLGYDKTYVSMIETGRRVINDMTTRRHIATTLGLPMHTLGVTGHDDADFAAMLQFGDSTIRLAEIARQAGRAVDAVNELWPLVARLEARFADGHAERDTLTLLGHARTALGVSLGTVLPEERLAVAARWTGRGLAVAEKLGDRAFLARALRMHGNELRKADHTRAAVAHLTRAVSTSDDADGRGAALGLLSRAAGELGDVGLFDSAISGYRTLLDGIAVPSMLVNSFTFREIHLRGLVSTGRASTAARLMGSGLPKALVAPQWYVIERVTTAEVLLAAGERDGADDALRSAVVEAEAHRLPHQIQRAVRAASRGGLADVAADGRDALHRIDALLAPSRPTAATREAMM